MSNDQLNEIDVETDEGEQNKEKLTLKKDKYIKLPKNMNSIFNNYKYYKLFERNINFRWFDIFLTLMLLDEISGYLLFKANEKEKYEVYNNYNTGKKY